MNNSTNNIYKNAIYSSIGTGISEIVTLPLCTIKTNFQNTNSISIISTIKDIYLREGIKSFYKASFPAIFSQIFSTSSKYVLYRYIDNNQFTTNKFFNGMTAGLISSLFTHPMDIVKIHMQMNKKFIPEFKKEGLTIFYRGYSKSFAKIMLSSSLYFPLYDTFNNYYKNTLYSSIGSAVITTLIIHPVDYLKTRHIYNLPLYQGYNPMIYYKGITLNMMRIIPHFVITMHFIDLLNYKN